ncbi:glycosyltransferase family 4 protein [Terricaulis sp.]|uniref:glycosyltransferase family 4 protein n=1 Tax=Terricaulis sp. TaxID=2768686 RepID=UPI003782FB07
MMRVCHVVRQFYPSVGGLETFVDMLARTLTDLGCRNDVLTLNRVFNDPGALFASETHIRGLRIKRVPMIGHRRFFWPAIPPETLAAYDVVHVHGIDGMFDRVSRQKKRRSQAFVASSHGAFFHTAWMRPVKQLYFETATRMAARRYDLLIANSSSDRALLQRLRDHVVHLPNGVAPIGDFCASGRDLLFIGRLSSHKHVERLIDAVAQPSLRGVRLHIVGPEWDVSRLRLAQFAEARGVGAHVLLHGGVDARRLAEIARSCALFVSASTYEGFGMSLIEGMSVGLPPVAQPNASFVELVEAAGVGALTDFADPQSAASAIRAQLDGLTDARRRRAMRYSEKFSWRAHAEDTLNLYRSARGERLLPSAALSS